ncbi:MAG: electron transport complex subunit RsxA [Candidatus Cloacimonetes bacterium]|nr:electron transport complex subunit RsxA [Candidatus Cloacimonadota bacterium]
MDILSNIFVIAISAIFLNNVILTRFLGLCPYLGVSKKLDSALGMGMAVTFVITMASAITWVINMYLLGKFNMHYLQTVAFILTIASLVQFVELFIQKTVPALYRSLGVYLPLITTNCAVLGIAIININDNSSFIDSVLNGFFGGIGFTFVIILMAGLRERLDKAEVPAAMKGMPIALVTAGCMALAFLGLSGLSF